MSLNPEIKILFFIVVVTITSYGLEIFYPGLINSGSFMALITLLVGSFAIYLYLKQKQDYKRDAANIILMEIRNAEDCIERVKSTKFIDQNKVLLLNHAWSKYNYLFINDFDRDEWDTVSNFYNQCRLYDEAVKQLKNIGPLQIEQKVGYVQKTLVDLAKEFSEKKFSENKEENEEIIKAYDDKKKKFLDKVEKESYIFPPSQPITDATEHLANIEKITTSTIGMKLKKIAGVKN